MRQRAFYIESFCADIYVLLGSENEQRKEDESPTGIRSGDNNVRMSSTHDETIERV